MKPEIEKYEKFEKYLSGKMKPEEQQAFEILVQNWQGILIYDLAAE